MAKRHHNYLGKLFFTLVVAVLFAVPLVGHVQAANPTTISFQGKVVNSNGTNVTNGSYGFVFKLYSAASGGTALWTESDTLNVTGGVFQVSLGANCSFFVANACNNNTPIDFNANPGLYLGVTFNADPAGEMSPRVQLQSVPFAYNADKVGGLSVSQLVQLSPSSQQTGTINVSGDITTAANIQGNAVNGVNGISTGVAGGTQRIDNSGNLLNIGTITGASALTVASGGTAQNISIDAATTGTIKIGAVSTGDIELGGGVLSGSGCTLTNSTGSFACTGSLTAATGATVGSTTTAGSIAFKDGTVSGNTATITAPVILAPYALTLPTSGPAVSQCLRTDSVTASQLVFGTCANIGQKLSQTFNAYGVNQAANATTALNFMLPTAATTVSFALAGTAEFKAASAGSFRACSIVDSAAVTAGTVSVRFRKNGANVSVTNHCTLSTTNPRTNSEDIPTGTETFAAGDTIGVALVSTGLAPVTNEHTVSFTVEYGAGGVGPTTMQDAYDNGSTITTADAKNITVNLANTTTDANYLINVATGSTGRFAVQNNGVDALSVGANGNLLTTGTVNGATITGGSLSATAVNSLNVSGTAISGSGTGLAISAGGAAQNLTLDGATLGKVVIGSVSTGDIEFGGGVASTGCTITNATGALDCSGTINGATITSTTFNTATISGGSLTGGSISAGSVSGGSLSATAVNGLNVSGNAIAASTAATFTIDANGSQQVSIAGTSTGDILIGGGVASTGCTITNATGALSCTSTINGSTITATSFNTATISGGSLTGGAVSGGSLSATTVNGLNVSSGALTATAAAPFTIDANTTQQISIGGTSTGDVLLAGGSAATGCTVTNSNGNLTCAGAFQSAGITSTGIVNATTQLQLNGANINTAGTLTNVAYLNQANTFSALNSFTGTGTALSVTNDASVGGTLTAGTFAGSGASITNLNASALASGTVPVGVVTGSYTGITGTGALTAGSIASGFGTIATTNSITTTAAMQGGTVTATGALAGNSLSINGGVLAVNSAGAITASTGATVTGSVSASTSVITPLLTTAGALTINSGAANNVTIDSAGAGTATVNIGTTNATTVGLSRTGQTTTVNGALAVNQDATFNQNVIMTFTGTENMSVTTDLAGNVSAISVVGTPSSTAGTTNGLAISQAASANTNGLDNGIAINNANTTTPIGSAISITNTGGGGYTNLISSTNFTLNGNGEIFGKGFDYFDPARLTGTTSVGSGGAATGNFGGVFSSGAFIDTTDYYGQEFVGSKANATTNNVAFGDDNRWYFNNNARANVAAQDVATTGGFARITSGAVTARGGLLTTGTTAGTQDRPLAAANLPIVQMKVRTSAAVVTDDVVFGMMDTQTALVTNDPLPTNGIVFFSNNAAASNATGWQGVIRSGGVTQATVTCPAAANLITGQFATGRIIVVNATTVRFFMDSDASNGVNFTDCGTATVAAANMPAAAMAMGLEFSQTNATAGVTVDLDYARYWQDDAVVDPLATPATTSAAPSDTTTAAAPVEPLVMPAAAPVELLVMPAGDSLITVGGQTIALVSSDGATSFSGAVQSDSLSVIKGLSVGGDATFAGLTTFQKLATFIAKTVFRQNVEFNAHIAVSSDTAGYVTFKTGENSIHVRFKDTYDQVPVVSVSNTDGQFVVASVNAITQDGFDVVLAEPAKADTTLSWIAVGVIDPKTTTTTTP